MLTHFKIITYSILLFSFSQNSFAISDGAKHFGLGLYANGIYKTTASNDRAPTPIGPISYPFQFRASWLVFDTYFFTPRIGYTLIPRNLKDTAGTENTLLLSFPLTKNFETSNWDWSIGLSIINQSIKGKGGAVSSTNGGSPATYYRPSRSSSISLTSADFGFGYNGQKLRMDFEFFIPGALTDKRSFNFMFSVHYPLGGAEGGYATY